MNAFQIIPSVAERWSEQLPSYEDIMRIIAARQALQRDVEQRRTSFEVQDYRKRRAAALRGRR